MNSSFYIESLGDKYYLDVDEDENYSGLGNVIAYITDVYIKLLQAKSTQLETQFSLTELLDWVSDEKVTVLYNCVQVVSDDKPKNVGKVLIFIFCIYLNFY